MKPITLYFACVGISLLTACQSTEKDLMAKNMEVNQQTQYFVEAKVLLDKLKQDITQGREDQLAYFAPKTFGQAVTEFDNANEEYIDIGKNGASSLNIFQSDTEQYKQAKQEIIGYITLANQKLKFSYSIKKTAESTLAETFTQKALLERINTPKIYASNYKRIIARIDDLVEYIDDGEVSRAQKNQPKLLADMQALEVKTIRKSALGQLDRDIAYIKKKRLAKNVPISHQQLLTARSNANAIITESPRATTEIKAAVVLAEFELAHLYHIAKEVSELNKTKEKHYEQYLLAKETLLHTVSESLGTDDVRDLALTQQVESIALQAGAIKGKLATANATVLALQNNSSQTSAATESLRTEFKSQFTDLNGKYDALVMENSELNKSVQNKNIELIRLQAYKEAVLQIKDKNTTEKTLAIQAQADKEQAQADKEAKQKALSLKLKAEKDALVLAEKAKKEAQQQVLTLEEKADKETVVLEKKAVEQKDLAVETQATAVTQLVEPVEQLVIEQDKN